MANKSCSISVFDNEVLFNGTLFSAGTLDIGGKLNGKIVANILTIKEGGVINGDIFANEIYITENGLVKGNIVAKKLHLSKNSNINGNIVYNTISIEDGSTIEGQCTKSSNEEIAEIVKGQIKEVVPDADDNVCNQVDEDDDN